MGVTFGFLSLNPVVYADPTCEEVAQVLGASLVTVEGELPGGELHQVPWQTFVDAAKDLYTKDGPAAYRRDYQTNRRTDKQSFVSRILTSARKKVRDILMPQEALSPWHYIENEESTAGVIRNFIEGIEKPKEIKKDLQQIDKIAVAEEGSKPPRPIETVRSWLEKYTEFSKRQDQTIKEGFVDLFNEVQFTRAQSLNPAKAQKVVIEIAKLDANQDVTFEERTFLGREIRPYLARLKNSRKAEIGKPRLLPVQSLNEAVSTGRWKKGGIFELDVEQAELHTKLRMVRDQMGKIKENFSRQGREFPKREQELLEQIDAALKNSDHNPSSEAFRELARREMWSQIRGWRSGPRDVQGVRENIVYRVLNPQELTRIGVLNSNAAGWLRFFTGRYGIFGILFASGAGWGFKEYRDWYQSYFNRVDHCAEQDTDREFLDCVNETMKVRFAREFYVTYFDEEHVPFQDENGQFSPEAVEALKVYWEARREHLEERRALGRFGKPIEGYLNGRKAEYDHQVKKDELAETVKKPETTSSSGENQTEQGNGNSNQTPSSTAPTPVVPVVPVKPAPTPPEGNTPSNEAKETRQSLLEQQALFFTLQQQKELTDRIRFLNEVISSTDSKPDEVEGARKEVETKLAELRGHYLGNLEIQRTFFGEELPESNSMNPDFMGLIRDFIHQTKPKVELIPEIPLRPEALNSSESSPSPTQPPK